MSITTEIQALNTNLTAAKGAVAAKGGTIGDTGLAGLAAEIATIPSGGTPVAPETLYGSALVYPFVRFEYGLEPDSDISSCTINSINQDKLGIFLEEHPSTSPERISFNYEEDYENPGNNAWFYEYDDPEQGYTILEIQEADMVSTTGIDVEVFPGETFAYFALVRITHLNTDISGWLNVLSSDEYDGIVYSFENSEGSCTIGGVKILNVQIKGFVFGSTNTTTPSFHSCNNFEVLNFDYASSLASISNNFLGYCTAFNQDIVMPNSVTTIGTDFLNGCTNFNHSVTISSNVTTIGNNFMRSCYAFNQPLVIPSGVTSIGSNFMGSCRDFNQPITIPSGVTAINSGFLSSCQNFNQPLTIPSNVITIGDSFLDTCRFFDQPIVVPNSVTSIGGRFMMNCIRFNKTLTLSFNLTAIGTSFMSGCTNFNQPVVIPNGVTSIEDSFLEDCGNLNQPLTLPSNLVTIKRYFLQGCSNYNQVLTIPTTTTTIGSNFMSNCRSFNKPLTIPSSITSIAPAYFLSFCNSMVSTITFEAPATVATSSPNTTLSTTTASAPCYVTGITLAGTYANAWKTKFPDRTTSPYRKLILA